MSPLNAAGVLARALRDSSMSPEQLTLERVPELMAYIDRGVRLFVAPDRQATVRREIEALANRTHRPESKRVVILKEDDISVARTAARHLCELVGSRSLVVQKVTTVVSELARNIVNYTPGGAIELSIVETSPQQMSIVAEDNGSGISNLELIMSGRYKSRTGLGKGILGVKRLSETFDIRTTSSGTRIAVTLCV
jgi:serine/threonine-protein kinase RsbT